MATINDSWDTTTPAGGDAVSSGDDKIRELKRAVEERMKNLGLKWPSGTDAASGIFRVSSDNYVADEVSIYASDESTKQIRVTDTAVELNDATTIDDTLDVTGNATFSSDLNCTGTLQEGGTAVVTQDTKRIVVLQQMINPSGADLGPNDMRLSFPDGVSSGTMTGFFARLKSSDPDWDLSFNANAFTDDSALGNNAYTSISGLSFATNALSISFTSSQGITVRFTTTSVTAGQIDLGVVLQLDY
jgi:hypothetical protein